MYTGALLTSVALLVTLLLMETLEECMRNAEASTFSTFEEGRESEGAGCEAAVVVAMEGF